MSNHDAIIFDLDGTLWDAIPATMKAWNLALSEMGEERRVNRKEIESITGKPSQEGVEILFSSLMRKHSNFKARLDHSEQRLIQEEGAEFYEGVIEGVKKLAKNYKIFLVSNCEGWYIDLFFKFSGLKSYFKAWDCHGISGLSKGEMLFNLKNKHSLLSPVYIGDTRGDWEAAQFAGMGFIHAAYGFGEVEEKVFSVKSIPEFLNYLLLMNK